MMAFRNGLLDKTTADASAGPDDGDVHGHSLHLIDMQCGSIPVDIWLYHQPHIGEGREFLVGDCHLRRCDFDQKEVLDP
jgi:hypothetical protein